MPQLSQRSTIYFDPDMHKALRLKAAEENRSISEIVNEAIAMLTAEDAEDIDAVDARAGEPGVSYAEFVQSLKSDGIL
jgi:plasmid stability protein